MRALAMIGALALLAACGADGEPIPPEDDTVSTRVDTSIGIGNNGVRAGTRISQTRGNVTIGVGVGL